MIVTDDVSQRRSVYRWKPGLLAQVLALVLVAVLVAQVVNFAVVLASPPPQRVDFSVEDVAAALQSAPSQAIARQFRISTRDAPPGDEEEDFRERDVRFAFAEQLGVPAEDVRFVFDFRAFQRVLFAMERPTPTVIARPFPLAEPPPGPRMLVGRASPRLLETFTVAVRREDGRWLWVRPRSNAVFNAWRTRTLAWFLMTTAIILPIGYAFARRLTAPIRTFAKAAERLGRNPQAPYLEVDGPAEIVMAAEALNDMQHRLQRYIGSRTQMLGAIAHDLRTPLMRLSLKLEMAPDDVRQRAESDILQMEEMIARILTFVRDASDPNRREQVDLQSMVESVAQSSKEVGCDVEVEPGERLVINADPLAIRRLVTNLVENAIKYGVRVRGRAYRDDRCAVIEIDDAGPGLPEHELDRVFEPFYRAEGSRNRDTGGAGLGLSVVRIIAQAHGGDAALSNLPEGGLRARITLPL